MPRVLCSLSKKRNATWRFRVQAIGSKRPNWLRDALAAGRSLKEFAVPPSSTAVAGPKVCKSKGWRRPSTVLYRDGAGNSWTGRGPKPRWFKEAIASGKSTEELSG
jgi:DNA-binding protein H-NS